jgi:protein-tyrosine phosphatase
MIDELDDLFPDETHPPTVGHLPSPVRPKPVKPDEHGRLIRQISFDLSRAEISTSNSGERDPPSRPPFARVHSPNTIGIPRDAPAYAGHIEDTAILADEEVSHHILGSAPATIKRNRSFGEKKPPRVDRTLSRATPSPQHMSRRQRAAGAASPCAVSCDSPPPPKAAWGLSLALPSDGGSSGGGGFVRPPPIHTQISLQSLDDENDSCAVQLPDTLARPPALSLGLISEASSEASAPPPTPRGGGGFGGLGGFGGSQRESAPPMSLVAPGLYVGNEVAASDLDALQAASVTHVLNCSQVDNALEGMDGAPPTYLKLGLFDNISDLPRMQEALDEGVAFISAALASGGTVLVHCRAGISRSATLAIAHLVRATQQPVDVVFEKMRLRRRVVDPNLGYFVALHEWEKRVLRRPGSGMRATPPLRAATPLEGMGLWGMPPARARPLSRAG